jgi:hypothetical protein
MSVDAKALDMKLREMYPEITAHKMDLGLTFDAAKGAWVVRLTRGTHELSTHLEAKDAEDCLQGIKCVYLGVQIGQFIKNFAAS